MRIITTIDDLGMHPAVRRAAEHLASRERVTSASLLVNGPDAEESMLLQGIGIGVQLNVLQGGSLLKQGKVSSLLRQDGRFLGRRDELFKRFLEGKVILAQIEQEWAAQIEFMLDHSLKPTHLASHGGMHAWPGLLTVAGRLARRYGIPWIRRPLPCEEVLESDRGKSRTEFMNLCGMLQQLPDRIGMTDYVWGEDMTGGSARPLAFLKAVRQTAHEVVEVVCRPGLFEKGDGPLAKGFRSGPTRAQWQDALAAMESGQWRVVYEELDAAKAHYGNVNEVGA